MYFIIICAIGHRLIFAVLQPGACIGLCMFNIELFSSSCASCSSVVLCCDGKYNIHVYFPAMDVLTRKKMLGDYIRPKLISNSDLVKTCSSIKSVSVVQSF